MQRLAHHPEILDGPLIDAPSLRENLRDLALVNRLFGGAALSRRALLHLVATCNGGVPADGDPRATVRLLDVGTGGADIPEALLRWSERGRLPLEIEAVDRAEVVALAREARGRRERLQLRVADGRDLPFPDRSFDVAHISLVAHHLEPDQLVRLLGELKRVSRLGVIVNDLQRSAFVWLASWLVLRLLTRNAVTRHDGPLSVRRAYRPAELAVLATRVALTPAARFDGLLGHRYALVLVPAADESVPRGAATREHGERGPSGLAEPANPGT